MTREEKIQKAFGVFLISDLQRVFVARAAMRTYDLSWEDLREYLDEYKGAMINQVKPRKVVTVTKIDHRNFGYCPECGLGLRGMPLKSNRDDYKVRLYCIGGWEQDDPDGICGYEIYYKETISEVQRERIRLHIEGRTPDGAEEGQEQSERSEDFSGSIQSKSPLVRVERV